MLLLPFLLIPYLNTVPVSAWVRGRAFDRFATIWLENTDYANASADPNLAWLRVQGITLSNNYAVTHPSQPNYAAAISGDYYGCNHDDFIKISSNVSTVVDLLEDRDISWGAYLEDLPYTGFEGQRFRNPVTDVDDYTRSHNPAVLYGSVTDKASRRANIRNLTLFYKDLKADRLPQWMFITPNLTNDGHDTNVSVAGHWVRKFLEPLLTNKSFSNNTLVLVTFDENHSYSAQNNILGILLGDAVPRKLRGTTDNVFYNHYSELSTVQANWILHTLGRWDIGANVYSFVARKTGDKTRDWHGKVPLDDMYFNASYPGKLNQKSSSVPWPVPNMDAKHSGRTVLPAIKQTWKNDRDMSIYTIALEVPDGMHPGAVLGR